jgi:hypothetical protein
MGAGTFLGGWPLYDGFKQEAAKRGIDLSPAYMEFLTEGLYESLIHLATGKRTNISSRVGPGNNQQLQEILSGDESFAGVMLGAAGGALGGIIKAMAPFYYWTAAVVSDTGDFKLQAPDWLRVFREISTFDNVTKAYGAVAYNEWRTKTGTVVDNKVDGMDAALAILGLTPLDVADTFLARKALQQEKAGYVSWENAAFENYRKAAQSLNSGNAEQAAEYFTNAKVLLEMGKVPWDRRERFYHRAISQFRTLEQQINWELLQNAPTNKKPERLEQFQRQYQKNQGR